MPRRVLLVALAVVALAGCQIPSDPDGTLERARGGELRVGASVHDPWVRLEGSRPAGVEPHLVEGFARELGARVTWRVGGEEALVRALAEGELDVVVGGITKRSPWKKEVAPTRPFATVGSERHVMLATPGENALLVRLERYLRAREPEVPRLLEREGAR